MISYHVGGFLPNAPAQNKAREIDPVAQTVTEWDAAGNVTVTRAVTPAESTAAAASAAYVTTVSNRASLQDKASSALAANATFLAIASPTNAQIAAHVKLLTRQNNALIRMTLGLLDDTSGT